MTMDVKGVVGGGRGMIEIFVTGLTQMLGCVGFRSAGAQVCRVL